MADDGLKTTDVSPAKDTKQDTSKQSKTSKNDSATNVHEEAPGIQVNDKPAPPHVDPHDLTGVDAAPTQPKSDTVRVRVLAEQQTHHSQSHRWYIPSGSEVDLVKDWAKELLERGEAEIIAQKGNERAEKRPSQSKSEKR